MYHLKLCALTDESGTNIFTLVLALQTLSPLPSAVMLCQFALSEKCTTLLITNANVLSDWPRETQFVWIPNAQQANISTLAAAK